MVAHIYNPSCSADRDGENHSLKPGQSLKNVNDIPISTNELGVWYTSVNPATQDI
jgi:hypothetical protein